jgi:hypothetical protein
MADTPVPPPAPPSFNIPAPNPSELQVYPGQPAPIREETAYARRDDRELKRGEWDWQLAFVLKIVLVCFVLGMNIWWTHYVRRWITDSGQQGSRFHLADSVLIALATTSVANFLALILVVMKNIFPDQTKK